MDAQTKEKLTRIEHQFEINKKYDGWLLLDKEDAELILRLVREQETHLAKHKRVVEVSKQLMLFNESLPWEQASSPSRMKDVFERLNDLKKAIEALETDS